MKAIWYIFHMWHGNWRDRNEVFGNLNLHSYKWTLFLLSELAARFSGLHLETKDFLLFICKLKLPYFFLSL